MDKKGQQPIEQEVPTHLIYWVLIIILLLILISLVGFKIIKPLFS